MLQGIVSFEGVSTLGIAAGRVTVVQGLVPIVGGISNRPAVGDGETLWISTSWEAVGVGAKVMYMLKRSLEVSGGARESEKSSNACMSLNFGEGIRHTALLENFSWGTSSSEMDGSLMARGSHDTRLGVL